jgi:translation initiation factor IF-2
VAEESTETEASETTSDASTETTDNTSAVSIEDSSVSESETSTDMHATHSESLDTSADHAGEQSEAAADDSEETESYTEEDTSEEAIADEEPEVAEELPKQESHITDMLDSINSPNVKTSSSTANAAMKQIDNVRTLSLNPAANRPKTQQPYRVAAPSLHIQGKKGIGRTKKPSSNDNKPKKVKIKREKVAKDEGPKLFNVSNVMTVRELSHKINVPETQIVTYFFMKKIIKTVNDVLEKDLIVEYLESMDYVVTTYDDENIDNAELTETLKEDETEGNLIARPPVVTIMGHVDHGKTTLIDCLRNYRKKVVDGEYGGITQHINAYQVVTKDYDDNDRKITFIDTPGHEAFTSMRKRGANITDIVVLIVAADDGVKPQTIESIKHIKDSKVPYLVAVNKMDKPGANVDKVFGQLAEYDIVVEPYGGAVVVSEISALQQTNIDDLLEKIILVADAELSEKIRSNPNRPAVGSVIEAEMSRNQGALTTALIQNGTLKIGDFMAAGATYGRVKAMFDENSQRMKEAGPSTPVKVLGLNEVPKAGDPLKVYSSIQEAKKEADLIAQEELEDKRFKGISTFASEVKEGQAKELRVIIKADVQGSAEAIAAEINKLSTEEVLVKPIIYESGSITANDVMLAEQTDALIVGFHVGTDSQTAKQAEKAKVKIKSYEIIYKLIEDIGRSVLGLHEPDLEESILGEAEVRKIFTIDKRNIAGCYVNSGEVVRSEKAKVIRDGVKIYEGKLDYLKRFKDDAKRVREGFECGISFERYNDLTEGDIVQSYQLKEIYRTEL